MAEALQREFAVDDILSTPPPHPPNEVEYEEEESPFEDQKTPEEEEEQPPAPSSTGGWQDAWKSAAEDLGYISLTVDNPESVGNALSKHVVYRVRCTVSKHLYEVHRRFSEFASLRELLVKRYVGLLLPPIPPKVLTHSNKVDSRFVQSRTRILRRFVSRLSALPWLSDDPVLRNFCSEENWKEDEEKVVFTESTGRGRAMWYAALARAPSPPDAAEFEKQLSEFGGRLEALEKSLDVLVKNIAKASQACQVRSDGLASLCEGLAPWRGESARFSAATQKKKLQPRAESAERAAAAITASVDRWSHDAQLEPVSLDEDLAGAASWQALHVSCARELVARRSTLLDELRKEQKNLSSLLQQKSAAEKDALMEASGSGPEKKSNFFSSLTSKKKTPVDYDVLIEDSTGAVQEKEKALDLHARALSYSELERFSDEYAVFATIAARHFFKSQYDKCVAEQAHWETALQAVGGGIDKNHHGGAPSPPHWMQIPGHLQLPAGDFDDDEKEEASV